MANGQRPRTFVAESRRVSMAAAYLYSRTGELHNNDPRKGRCSRDVWHVYWNRQTELICETPPPPEVALGIFIDSADEC
eukprot:6490492-Amphidinium_carterae.2